MLYNVNVDLENLRGICMGFDYMSSEGGFQVMKEFAKKVAAHRIGVEVW